MKTLSIEYIKEEDTKTEEINMMEIMNTFGGGMGGGRNLYYVKENDIIYDKNGMFVTIDNFGQKVILGQSHIVHIKEVKCIKVEGTDYRDRDKKIIRYYLIPRRDDEYDIRWGYQDGCSKDIVYQTVISNK